MSCFDSWMVKERGKKNVKKRNGRDLDFPNRVMCLIKKRGKLKKKERKKKTAYRNRLQYVFPEKLSTSFQRGTRSRVQDWGKAGGSSGSVRRLWGTTRWRQKAKDQWDGQGKEGMGRTPHPSTMAVPERAIISLKSSDGVAFSETAPPPPPPRLPPLHPHRQGSPPTRQ